jgi:hypothetical protein
MKTVITLAILSSTVPLIAQNYQVNWSVVDIGGGAMSSTSYKADASVGQTAAGPMTGTAYQAFIGFWQIDTSQVGIVEDQHWEVTEPLTTALYTPYPNPSPLARLPAIHYSLATEGNVNIGLFDLSGRVVATLISTRQKPGRYSLSLSAHSSLLTAHSASGVYFLKMTAGDYSATRKLVLH